MSWVFPTRNNSGGAPGGAAGGALTGTYPNPTLVLAPITGRIKGSDGTTLGGTGFAAVRNSAGNYTVTFTTAFPFVPSVQVTAVNAAAGASGSIEAFSASVNGFSISNLNQAFTPADPVEVDFLATNPGS